MKWLPLPALVQLLIQLLAFQVMSQADYELTACLLRLSLNNHFEISYIWK